MIDLNSDNSSRRGGVTTVVLIVLAIVAALGVGFTLLNSDTAADPASRNVDVFPVRKGSFDITIPATGELAALRQVEIKNELEVRAVIMEIVEEGDYVQEGDLLFRLNDEDIVNNIKDREGSVDVAQNALDTAIANKAIVEKERESAVAEADLKIKLAELALEAWREGELVSKRKELALAEETAEKNYDRLVARFEVSKDLLKQEFISEDEYKRDEISMIEARAKLEQARLDTEVYNTYTYEKDLETKRSDVKQARDERVRTEARYNAELQSADSDVRNRTSSLEREKEKLEKLRRQLEYCTVYAPSEGLVVYATSLDSGRWGRNNDDPPRVGTELPRNRTVIVLPDTSKMVAAVKVNEALSGSIEPGQRATIFSDAMPDTAFTGEVLGVGVLAESGGWRDPNRRDYTVRILLDGDNAVGLKPSMRCKATIHVGSVENSLYAPIQAVHHRGPQAYVYTAREGGYAQTPVDVGRTSELYVELLSGVEEGDLVLLRQPDSSTVVSTLKRSSEQENERPRGEFGADRPTSE